MKRCPNGKVSRAFYEGRNGYFGSVIGVEAARMPELTPPFVLPSPKRRIFPIPLFIREKSGLVVCLL